MFVCICKQKKLMEHIVPTCGASSPAVRTKKKGKKNVEVYCSVANGECFWSSFPSLDIILIVYRLCS